MPGAGHRIIESLVGRPQVTSSPSPSPLVAFRFPNKAHLAKWLGFLPEFWEIPQSQGLLLPWLIDTEALSSFHGGFIA